MKRLSSRAKSRVTILQLSAKPHLPNPICSKRLGPSRGNRFCVMSMARSYYQKSSALNCRYRSRQASESFSRLCHRPTAQLSQILANRELNSQVGELFWREFAVSELERRRIELEAVQRLRSEDQSACDQAAQELKEVLDLQTRITDMSRLPSRAP